MSLKCSVLKSGICELTQGFGGANNHRGLDLVDKGYTIGDIVSYGNGTVVMVTNGYGNGQGEGANWAYGNFVKILHDDGTVCLYAHMEYTNVAYGQRVSKGQLLGRMGNSGNSGGGHLHWEFWSSNNYNANVDPMPYLEPKQQYNYEGNFEEVTKQENNKYLIKGWFWDGADATNQVHIYIRQNGENKFVVGVDCNIKRDDLITAKKGNGCHAFAYEYDFDQLGAGTYDITAYQIRHEVNNNQSMGTKTITIVEKVVVEEPKELEKPDSGVEKPDIIENEPEVSPEEPIEDGQANTPSSDKTTENDTKNEEKSTNAFISIVLLILKVIIKLFKGGK